jgi:hypothetical protein
VRLVNSLLVPLRQRLVSRILQALTPRLSPLGSRIARQALYLAAVNAVRGAPFISAKRPRANRPSKRWSWSPSSCFMERTPCSSTGSPTTLHVSSSRRRRFALDISWDVSVEDGWRESSRTQRRVPVRRPPQGRGHEPSCTIPRAESRSSTGAPPELDTDDSHASAFRRVRSMTRRTRLMRSQGCHRRALFTSSAGFYV